MANGAMSERDLLKLAQLAEKKGDIETVRQAVAAIEAMRTPSPGSAMAPGEIPQIVGQEPSGAPILAETPQPPRPPEQEMSLADRFKGMGEVALTAITGATGGMAGTLFGTGRQMLQEAQSGQFGTPEAVQRIQQSAMEAGGALTYQPRTEAGMGMLGTVEEVTQGIPAFVPTIGPAGAATSAARGALAQRGVMPRIPVGVALPEGVTKEDVRIAEDVFGVPVFTSDVRPPQTFLGKMAQMAQERIPLTGTGEVRAGQLQRQREAIQGVVENFDGTDISAVPQRVFDDIVKTRGNFIARYTNDKNEVIDRLSAEGRVPMGNTIGAIDTEIARLQGKEQFAPIVNALESYKRDFTGRSLSEVESLRKALGDVFKSEGLANVRGEAEKTFRRLYGPVLEDMKSFISENGERRDIARFTVANRRLAEEIQDLKDSSFKAVLNRGEVTPEITERLLGSKKPSEMQRLYKNLSEEGRASVRSWVLGKAYQDATRGDEISPPKFLNSLEKQSAATGVFFKGREKDEVEGLVRVLQYTDRASKAAVLTQTGQQSMPFIAGGVIAELFGGAAPAAAAALSAGVLARAYESRPVRNLLMKIGKAKKSSSAEEELVRRFNNTFWEEFAKIQVESARQQTQQTVEDPEPPL